MGMKSLLKSMSTAGMLVVNAPETSQAFPPSLSVLPKCSPALTLADSLFEYRLRSGLGMLKEGTGGANVFCDDVTAHDRNSEASPSSYEARRGERGARSAPWLPDMIVACLWRWT
jgi:hypothetical protein